MILKATRLMMIRQDDPDPMMREILHSQEILENLSEARSFPPPLTANICFRIEQDQEVIGQVCIKSIRWINRKAEISLFIKSEKQGKGYGGEALEAAIQFAFNRMNLYRLEAEVIDGNIPSIKLLKRNGFKEEGRLREAKFVNGEYKDLLRFGLLRKEYTQ